jgi:hypothetical protein
MLTLAPCARYDLTEGLELSTPLSHLEFIPSASNPINDERHPRGMKQFWPEYNVRSVDGKQRLWTGP